MKRGELLVFDQPEPCPYLPGRVARMPLRRPTQPLSGRLLDELLAEGDRRCGEFLYRTHCAACRACEPIRIPVADFKLNRTQRRTLKRNDQLLKMDIGPTQTTERRVALFNEHRAVRALDQQTGPLDAPGYAAFLEETCCDTVELRYHFQGNLAAIAVTDVGERSMSAVYCYYDPAYSRLSLGTYSVLKQIELCQTWEKRYLYLGLYIAESKHMSYKALYLPHERLRNGVWQTFE